MPSARRRPSSTSMRRSTSRAASSGIAARPIGSTAARCARATCRSCWPTPRPGRARPHSCAKDLAVRVVAERTGEQAQASTRQALAAAALPALRNAEAKAAAALHRLVIARETLEREEARARERMAELDQRLIQLDADIERE